MLAQKEARRTGHNCVGTEQILLGLIGEGTGIAARVLKSFGINLKDARIEVEKIIGRGEGFANVEIPFTPRAKLVFELATEESRQLKQQYVGTEHLLLGIIREGTGIAARVLENLGVNLEQLRDRVIEAIENEIRKGAIASSDRSNSSQLVSQIDRLLAIFENALYEGTELIDRINRELNKKAVLNNEIAEVLNKLSESSPSKIKEFLTELQTAIETDTQLSSESKEEALEMVLIIAEALQDLKDSRQQKLATSALKILRSIIKRIMRKLS